jgi:hypothetical protein
VAAENRSDLRMSRNDGGERFPGREAKSVHMCDPCQKRGGDASGRVSAHWTRHAMSPLASSGARHTARRRLAMVRACRAPPTEADHAGR